MQLLEAAAEPFSNLNSVLLHQGKAPVSILVTGFRNNESWISKLIPTSLFVGRSVPWEENALPKNRDSKRSQGCPQQREDVRAKEPGEISPEPRCERRLLAGIPALLRARKTSM